MPLHCHKPRLPSLSFTVSTNHGLLSSLHKRQSNSHDKIQNAGSCGLLCIAQAPQHLQAAPLDNLRKKGKKTKSTLCVHMVKHCITPLQQKHIHLDHDLASMIWTEAELPKLCQSLEERRQSRKSCLRKPCKYWYKHKNIFSEHSIDYYQ